MLLIKLTFPPIFVKVSKTTNPAKENLKPLRKRSILMQTKKVLGWSEIGKFKTVERLVNLNADRKRLWFQELKNIEDEIMIDSMPISLNYFEKNQV